MWDEWYPGIILFCLHLFVMGLIYISIHMEKWKIVYGLKIVEFLVHFFLFGWSAGYFGAETFSLSVLMIVNYLVLMMFIYFFNNVSLIILIIMLILLLINSVLEFSLSEEWW
jgi:hypothetical protein